MVDHDATAKLAEWFEARWNDRWCLDISEDLAALIEESWAREELIPPYHIYLKMAYHLSREARAGLTEFRIPDRFAGQLFEYQERAVQMAAGLLHRRGGVLIGDVVGLGKTFVACALAKILEERGLETLFICPTNLQGMWRKFRLNYALRGEVIPLSKVIDDLRDTPPHRVVVIDESHNLRNRETARYRAIRDYIQRCNSKVILLTATPYNKSFEDLSSQLRLFVDDKQDIGIRPERKIREISESEFKRRYQCPLRSIPAFERSEHPDDWRDLMRLYMVRRTRAFIKDNYAEPDENGRLFLTYPSGERSYFPERVPKTARFPIDDDDPTDQYACLYADDVVNTISSLNLPRYGLGMLLKTDAESMMNEAQKNTKEHLSRAGQRLIGFCRTNLFKRLESGGDAFLQSLDRHIVRNYVFIHALEAGKDIPIGTQHVALLDSDTTDQDVFWEDREGDEIADNRLSPFDDAVYAQRGTSLYNALAEQYRTRIDWLPSRFFKDELLSRLRGDAHNLTEIVRRAGKWESGRDTKLAALYSLLTEKHPNEKVIVFSQYADTVDYLERELKKRGVASLEGVTGGSSNPTGIATRFSPVSNGHPAIKGTSSELRVVLATEVLSEGQNLQDCSIVVNYDLPWAIIRLIQRVGRVDRIGQQSKRILCYTFMPADGVERIIRLRARVKNRLAQNREVVGTDESFFEDADGNQKALDIYNEKSGVLDEAEDREVDLGSRAYEIWRNATERDPSLNQTITELPPVVYSAKQHSADGPGGALVYVQTSDQVDALAWIDENGDTVSESPVEILEAAECEPNTPAVPRADNHHYLVRAAVDYVDEQSNTIGGGLGRPSGPRSRTYERLRSYAQSIKDTLFDTKALGLALEDINQYPLTEEAHTTLDRHLRSGISDEELARLVLSLRENNRLCVVNKDGASAPPQIICTMGLIGE